MINKLLLTFVFFLNILTSFCFADKPLKVLFITSQFPVLSHTPEYNQAASLIDRDVDLTIFASGKNNLASVHDVIRDYDLASRVIYRRLPRNLDKYDVIHVQFAGLLHKHLTRLSKYSGKIVCSSRGKDTSIDLQKYPNEIPAINNLVDCFLPVSENLQNYLIDLGIDPEKVKVLRSSINLDKFHYRESKKPKNGKIKIISVCRLVEKKGLDDALNAIALVKKVNPNIEYTVIGAGEDKDKLVELAKQLQIEDVVVFAGSKKQEEVAAALSQSHLFLLPSKTAKDNNVEGIPNACKEAMAVGLPVISTTHGGIPELIKDGVSGFLVPENSPNKIANRILHLIRHPHIWKPVGEAGRKVIEQEYEMNVVNEGLYQMYLDLLKSNDQG